MLERKWRVEKQISQFANTRAGNKCQSTGELFLSNVITTLSRVRPCALWIVTAHASFSSSCNREHWALNADQVWRMGTIGTVPSGSVGPG